MRTLLLFGLFLAAIFLYVDHQGGAIGYAPFTPVYYWKYSGDARYMLRATGANSFVKVQVSGKLQEGSLEVWVMRGNDVIGSRAYTRSFSETLRYPVEAGIYEVVFRLKNARGQARLDWVTAKNEW